MHPKIVRTLTAALLALGLVANTACSQPSSTSESGSQSNSTAPPATTPSAGAESASAATTGGELTVGTTEGPYYVTGTAELKDGNLNSANLPGEEIRIRGHVYGGPGTSKPLPGAKIEIWHADSEGVYHPNGNGEASQYSASELALRGYVITDSNGAYEFTSVYPGYYQGRARHIHVRASAEGYGAVVTQIIVPPRSSDGVTPESDMIAQSLPAANKVTFSAVDGLQTATFDFHLGAD